MKLNTNFVNSSLIVMPVVGFLLWSASLLLILLSLLFVVDRQQMNADIEILNSENKKLSLQNEKSQRKNKQVLPSLIELQNLVKKASTMNAVSKVKGNSIAVLLTRLERSLPKDTFLKNLGHYPRKGEVLLTAVSPKADLLTQFLRKLEKDKHFERVMLLRQSKNESQNNEVEFDLRLIVTE